MNLTKLGQKIISLNLALIMVFSLLPMGVLAADTIVLTTGTNSFSAEKYETKHFSFTSTKAGLYKFTLETTTFTSSATLQLYENDQPVEEVEGYQLTSGSAQTGYQVNALLKAGETYSMTLTASVSATTSYTLKVEDYSSSDISLTLNTPKSFGTAKFLSFTPSKTGYYALSASNNEAYSYGSSSLGYYGNAANARLDGGKTYYFTGSSNTLTMKELTPTTLTNGVTQTLDVSSEMGDAQFYTFTPSTSGTYHFDLDFTKTSSGDLGNKIPPLAMLQVVDDINLIETSNPFHNGNGVVFEEYFPNDGFLTQNKLYDIAKASMTLTAGVTYHIALRTSYLFGEGDAHLSVSAEGTTPTPPPTIPDVIFTPASGSTMSAEDFISPRVEMEYAMDILAHDSVTHMPAVDWTKEPFTIHRADNNEVVYQLSTYEGGPNWSARVDYRSSDKNAITVELFYLERGTSYYVTMGSGFLCYADGSPVAAIEKGDWTFETEAYPSSEPFKANITMSNGFSDNNSESSSVTVDWDDNWFVSPSVSSGKGNYIHDLAISSIALSGSAYSSQWAEESLEKLGFYQVESNYPQPTSYAYDTISFTMGKKEISENGKPVSLVAVVIKGTSADAEWQSNFDIGTGSTHKGFEAAAKTILEQIEKRCVNLDPETTRYYITGHSRGGAVANLVAANLSAKKPKLVAPASFESVLANQENVFAYTFAAPTVSTKGTQTGYENIFNITNGEDFISQAPLAKWGFAHYGIDLMLPSLSYTKYGPIFGYDEVYSEYKSEMNKTFEKLTGAEFETYPSGVGKVSDSLDNMYELARNLDEYYNKTYLYTVSLVHKISPYDYFTVIAEISQEMRDGANLMGYIGKYASLSNFFLFNTKDNIWIFDVPLLNPYISVNHSVAAYYSWLAELTPQELFTSTNTTSQANYKKINIACPVDVYVYDSEGTLVASVVNNEVVENTIAIWVEEHLNEEGEGTGDYQKVVHLPQGDEFRIEIKGTDDGTMEYSVEEMMATGIGSTTNRSVSFETIEIAKDEVLTAKIDDTIATEVENYNLTKKDGTVIVATADEFSYTITLEHKDGAETISKVTTESEGTLSSLPNLSRTGYTFKGWYTTESGGTKVTTSTVFTENTTIYGQWTSSSSTGSTGGTSGGADASSSVTTPILNVSEGGTASITPERAENGQTVTITAKAKEGFALSTVTVTDRESEGVEVRQNEDGTYKFTQPISKVTIDVVFRTAGNSGEIFPEELFFDVKTTDWHYSYVKFVLERGLMTGMGDQEFAPDAETLRGMIVTVLYSMANKPESNNSAGFFDVSSGDYYYFPCLWASEHGVVSGVGDNLFAPGNPVSRQEICQILYKYALTQTDLVQSPAASAYFADGANISSWAQEAVNWCFENDIVTGRDGGNFAPLEFAKRAEIATMLTKFVLLMEQ